MKPIQHTLLGLSSQNLITTLQMNNKLLNNRNELLVQENQRMLCELQMANIQMDQLRQQLGLRLHTQSTSTDGAQVRKTSRRQRTEKEQLMTLKLEREETAGIFKQWVPNLMNKLKSMHLAKQLQSRLELLSHMQNSGCHIGTIRSFFQVVDMLLATHSSVSQRQKRMADMESYLKLQQQRRTSLSRSGSSGKMIIVKDPQYVVQQTKWIQMFQGEYIIVKNFYQSLINKITSRQQHRPIKILVHDILLTFQKLQLKKLQLQRLAIRIDNQQREYNLRLKNGAPMQALRFTSQKLTEALRGQQNQLRRLKNQISGLLGKLSG